MKAANGQLLIEEREVRERWAEYYEDLIERIRSKTESVIGEEQCGFRRGRGCADQVFAV